MSGRGIRIAGGTWRGRRLPVPARGVRPTEGRVREALFSIWQDQVPGCSFLDLFAGSGAVGVEALSRGAARVTAIEGAAANARALETLMGDEAAFEVVRARLPEGLSATPPRRFDLIFADPPYRFDGYRSLLTRVAPWLAAHGELAIEHAADDDRPDPLGTLEPAGRVAAGATADGKGPALNLVEQRRYGTTLISFFRHPEPSSGDATG